MRVLFATAELAPVAAVGGLGEAVAGLVDELRDGRDVDVDVVLPDYAPERAAPRRRESAGASPCPAGRRRRRVRIGEQRRPAASTS